MVPSPLATRRRVLAALAAGAAAASLPTLACAQTRPIHFIVPYPAGGPLDIVARALAEKVKDSLGVIVVENKPGAGGNIGADYVAKAAPDGTTIVMGAVATHAINPWLYAKLPYDPIRDFTPITGVARVPNVLVMTPETAARLGIASVADLVAYAKKNPGKLNYGSGGNGSAGHLAGEMFKAQAGVYMVHIPYAGGNPAQLALLSGQVDLTFDNLALCRGQHQGRPPQGAGRDDGSTLERDARSADHRGSGQVGRPREVRRRHLVRHLRPGPPAARDHAPPQQGLRRCHRVERGPGPPGCVLRRADADDARAFRRLREERARQVRTRRQGFRCTHRMSGCTEAVC